MEGLVANAAVYSARLWVGATLSLASRSDNGRLSQGQLPSSQEITARLYPVVPCRASLTALAGFLYRKLRIHDGHRLGQDFPALPVHASHGGDHGPPALRGHDRSRQPLGARVHPHRLDSLRPRLRILGHHHNGRQVLGVRFTRPGRLRGNLPRPDRREHGL